MAKELVELGRKCGPGRVDRAAYTRKDGTHVKAGCTVDQGKPGKTPASKKVLPEPVKGDLSCKGRDWNHKDPAAKRRSILKCIVTTRLKAQGDACQSGIGRLNLLANLTTTSSPKTHREARADMAWLRKQKWCKLKSKKK